jgi:Fe-S cluster assembly iron-binding protein IscA
LYQPTLEVLDAAVEQSRRWKVLQLTPKAASHLVRVRRERGFDDRSGARFVSNGTRVGLTFARAAKAGDRIIERSDIPIYVAPEVAEALSASVIDARVVEGKSVLVRRAQPAAAATPESPR